jgi:hypothetical protein
MLRSVSDGDKKEERGTPRIAWQYHGCFVRRKGMRHYLSVVLPRYPWELEFLLPSYQRAALLTELGRAHATMARLDAASDT